MIILMFLLSGIAIPLQISLMMDSNDKVLTSYQKGDLTPKKNRKIIRFNRIVRTLLCLTILTGLVLACMNQ